MLSLIILKLSQKKIKSILSKIKLKLFIVSASVMEYVIEIPYKIIAEAIDPNINISMLPRAFRESLFKATNTCIGLQFNRYIQ